MTTNAGQAGGNQAGGTPGSAAGATVGASRLTATATHSETWTGADGP